MVVVVAVLLVLVAVAALLAARRTQARVGQRRDEAQEHRLRAGRGLGGAQERRGAAAALNTKAA